MDLVVLNQKQTPYALRALRGVVASNGTITPERRFIEVVAELHAEYGIPPLASANAA